MASNRVVDIVPVRVVDIIPVRLGPPVVEIVPVLVVEMIPDLVVEMVPVFANAVVDKAITSVAAQTIDLRFLIALLLRDFQVRGYAVGLWTRLLAFLQADSLRMSISLSSFSKAVPKQARLC